MPKQKKDHWMPHYSASPEEKEHDKYCIRNDIRIAPAGIYGKFDEWGITVSIGPNYRSEKRDPNTYGPDEIWQKIYEYKKYYYDKHSKTTEGDTSI